MQYRAEMKSLRTKVLLVLGVLIVSFHAVGAPESCTPSAAQTLLAAAAEQNIVVLHDDFTAYRTGIWMGVIGAEAEYHYLPQTARIGNWGVSTYRSEPESQRAWRIEESDGHRVLAITLACVGVFAAVIILWTQAVG